MPSPVNGNISNTSASSRVQTFANAKLEHFHGVLEQGFATLAERLLVEFQEQISEITAFGAMPFEVDEIPMETYGDLANVSNTRDDAATQISSQLGMNVSISDGALASTELVVDNTAVAISSDYEEYENPPALDRQGTTQSGVISLPERNGSQLETPVRIDRWLKEAVGLGQPIIKSIENQDALLLCDVISCILICCNIVVIGWQLQHRFAEGSELGSETAVDVIFCAAFVLELLVRAFLERRNGFFTGVNMAWNCFDLLVVTTLFIETILVLVYDYRGNNLAAVRASRFLRLTKIVRAVKILRFIAFFRSGRTFVMTILRASSLILWIGLICFVMSYIFAVLIAARTVDECSGDANSIDLLCVHFGSVWRSCSSIYQGMLGGIRWGVLYDALQALEAWYVAGFLVYITFLYCVVLQIIIGVFVVQFKKQHDLENGDEKVEHRLKKEQEFLYELVECFRHLDVNDNGTLCKAELNEAFSDKSTIMLLGHHDLDTGSVEVLFDMLDHDHSGEVDMKEFVQGCVRLRGHARAMELERIRKDVKDMQKTLNSIAGLQAVASSQVQTLASIQEQTDQIPEVQRSVTDASCFSSPTSRIYVNGSLRSSRSYDRAPLAQRSRRRSITLIPKAEMRAMTVAELLEVVSLIKHGCFQEGWSDLVTGGALLPENVNLYHFNYYAICPKTSSPSIVLTGLNGDYYPWGGILKQYDSDTGRILAQAEIVDETQGTDVEVRLVAGQFFPQQQVFLQTGDADKGKHCGAPELVSSRGASISYKELVSQAAAKPNWFVSHWWGESIKEFVMCCQEHSKRRRKDKYWVCAYANRQHDLSLELNNDPEDTSFRKAMRVSEGVLLVLDANATPFHRIWCCFELYKTIHEGKMLDIVTARKNKPHFLSELPFPNEQRIAKTRREQSFPLQVLMKGLEVQLENGIATMEKDKINILNSMGKDPRTGQLDEELRRINVEKANKSLRAYFALAAWPQALKRGLVRKFAFGDGIAGFCLSDIISADTERAYLQLSLSGLREMNDEEMKSISESLPSSLEHLHLSFENCDNITDGGVSHLSNRIVMLPLRKLELFFTSCERLTDAGLLFLVLRLPATVADVKLNFAFCPRISKAGLREVSETLPSGLKNFQATFWGSGTEHQKTTFTSVQELRRTTGRRSSRTSLY